MEFAHEYVFTTVYEDAVYNAGPVQDEEDFLKMVKDNVAAIKADAVNDSTYVYFKGSVYKITVNDKGPLVPLPPVERPDGMPPMPPVPSA